MVVALAAFGARTSERWTLAMLAGLFNGIGFVYWGPISLVANVPLLLALRHSRSAVETAFLGGLVGLLGGLHIYGIVNYGWFLLIGFSLYTASQMVIYASLFRLLDGSRWPLLDVLLPAGLWALSEWIRTVGPLCMPASYVGNIANVELLRPWISLAAVTGGLGVSTLVAAVQGCVLYGLIGSPAHRRSALAVFGVVLSLGFVGYFSQPELSEPRIKVVGVQGGLANSQYHAAAADPAAMTEVVRTYEALTQEAYAESPEIVIWPETAIRAPVLTTPELRKRLFPSAQSNTVLLAGLIETDLRGRRYNVMAAVEAGGQIVGRYPKVRLVPGTEAHFTAGPEFAAINTRHGSIGTLICLESVYPDAARKLVESGAQLLVVASNDAGFGWSPISHHMMNRAIIRAVETRRWLIRVGQAGISTVVSPSGQTSAHPLALFKPGLLRAEVERRTGQTLFVRWGDWWVGVILVLLALTALARRRDSTPG